MDKKDVDFFSDTVRVNGRLQGLLDALRVVGEYMNAPADNDETAYEAARTLYQRLEGKYEEIEATRPKP